MAVFQSLANAHYGGAFYAVFRENCTDLSQLAVFIFLLS
jgi:hypothetical protein